VAAGDLPPADPQASAASRNLLRGRGRMRFNDSQLAVSSAPLFGPEKSPCSGRDLGTSTRRCFPAANCPNHSPAVREPYAFGPSAHLVLFPRHPTT